MLSCPSSTNDRHATLFRPLPPHHESHQLTLAFSPPIENRAPPRGDAPCSPLPLLFFSPLYMDTYTHTHTPVQDDSNYVTTPRACDLLLSSSPFPLSLYISLSLPLPEKYLSFYLHVLDSPARDPLPSPPPFSSRGGTLVYARYMWRSIYLFRCSGQRSTRLKGSRQSPLVHRAACYSSSFALSFLQI